MTDPLTALRRALFLASMPVVFISFALPIRARELGAGALEVGALFSVFTAAMLIVRPLVGVGLDRFGRRGFLIGGLVVHVVTNALYAWTDTLGPMYVARLLQGTGLAAMLIAADTITADLTDPMTRGAGLGGVIESQARGGMAGAVIGFSLVGAVPLHAWTASFTTFAVVAGLAVALAWGTHPETLRPTPMEQWTLRFEVSPVLRRLLAVVCAVAFAGALVQPLYLIYLQDRFGLELQDLALVFVPVGIAFAVLPARLGRWTASIDRARAAALGIVVSGVVYASVPLLPQLVLIGAAFVLAAVGGMLAGLTQNAWVADLVEEKATGRAYALAQVAAGLGAVLGPLLGGALYEYVSPDAIFYANGAVMGLAALLALLFVGRRASPTA